jgi:hypothetical protein
MGFILEICSAFSFLEQLGLHRSDIFDSQKRKAGISLLRFAASRQFRQLQAEVRKPERDWSLERFLFWGRPSVAHRFEDGLFANDDGTS